MGTFVKVIEILGLSFVVIMIIKLCYFCFCLKISVICGYRRLERYRCKLKGLPVSEKTLLEKIFEKLP